MLCVCIYVYIAIHMLPVQLSVQDTPICVCISVCIYVYICMYIEKGFMALVHFWGRVGWRLGCTLETPWHAKSSEAVAQAAQRGGGAPSLQTAKLS